MQVFEGAKQRLTLLQCAVFPLFVALVFALWYALPFRVFVLTLGVSLTLLFGAFVTLRIVSIFFGMMRRYTLAVSPEEIGALKAESLPIYTILLPVYREPQVIHQLLRAVGQLDYPSHLLDVKLLLEADDATTRAALDQAELPSWLHVIEVPEGIPKTKPRACNVGLESARGKYVVIFDAEDKPDPLQLKIAVAAFRKEAPDVVCLQAKLSSYNAEQNTLTRLFTLEYAAWFDLYLSGLYAIGAPIPLGGTSNHFRIEALRELGGWDPWNVAEDCDLGMRIARARFKTRVIESTTWEEAPTRWTDWFKQRTRWLKGYLQTFVVHTRNPIATAREFGLRKYALFAIVVGGQVGALLLAPFCWLVVGAWIIFRWPIINPQIAWMYLLLASAIALILMNVTFVAVHIIAAFRRQWRHLAWFALLTPFYWGLAALATWRGFFHFFFKPYKWEKTPHGLASHSDVREAMPVRFEKQRRWSVGTLGFVVSTVVVAAVPIVHAIRYLAPVHCYDSLVRTPGAMECTVWMNESWLDLDKVRFDLVIPDIEKVDLSKIHVTAFLIDGNEDRYEIPIPVPKKESVTPSELLFEQGAWKGAEPEARFNRWVLDHVKWIGIKVTGDTEPLRRIDIGVIDKVERKALRPELQALVRSSPQSVEQNALMEVRFDLNQRYTNPFDPDEIDVLGVLEDPKGETVRVPAFFTQEFLRKDQSGVEVLVPQAAPHWALRWRPEKPGKYLWHLEGKDKYGGVFTTEHTSIDIKPSKLPGGFYVPKGSTLYHRRGGGAFYPIGLNLGFPVDQKSKKTINISYPDPAAGSLLMERYLKQMGSSGMNFARMWMVPWWGSLEWNDQWKEYSGLGKYNLKNAWRMDRMLDVAESQSVALELVLNTHGQFATRWDSQWKDNPFNSDKGGFLDDHEDVFTSAQAKQMFLRRYRYLTARYGAHPALFGWVLWNEADVINDSVPALREWHKEMAPALRKLDFNRHPITTAFYPWTDEGKFDEIWSQPDIDSAQITAYVDPAGFISTILDRDLRVSGFGKPALISEFGGHTEGADMKVVAHEIHDGLWMGWLTHFAATPLAWWWNLVFEKGLDHLYSDFSAYIDGEALPDPAWDYGYVPVESSRSTIVASGRVSRTHGYFWVFDNAVSNFMFPLENKYVQTLNEAHFKATSFDPLAPESIPMFLRVTGATMQLPVRLGAGKYLVEFWDTWGRGKLSQMTFEKRGESSRLPLPPFSRDIAVKIKRIPDSHPMEVAE